MLAAAEPTASGKRRWPGAWGPGSGLGHQGWTHLASQCCPSREPASPEQGAGRRTRNLGRPQGPEEATETPTPAQRSVLTE